MEVVPGLRVVRGPDWEYGDQDGGEGHVGTVVGVSQPADEGRSVMVQWDGGGKGRYRCGLEDRYELRVFDSAPVGMKYTQAKCYHCRVRGISGMLWKCVKCFEYFLCTACYSAGKHSLEHEFLRIESEDMTKRSKLTTRARARVVEARGIFPNAEVVRGLDWRWGDQDGGPGSVGKVLSVKGWKETTRSVAEVEWIATRKKNIYRTGHSGKVDLKYRPSRSGSGGYYYPEHLPILGAPYMSQRVSDFAAGDRVKVELDPDVWRLMQEGHGGWNDLMTMFIAATGTVHSIDDSGDLVVNYMSNAMFRVNPDAVVKVDVPVLKVGDVVCLLDDMTEVSKLQKGHGEWVEGMAVALGQVGRIVKLLPSGDVSVAVIGKRWIFNPQCMKLAPEEVPPRDLELDEDHVGALTRSRLQSLLEKMNPDVVLVAASAGDDATIREFLKKCPNEVNAKHDGKTALHIAVQEGYLNVLRTLLDFNPNLNVEDDNSERPLHYCAQLHQEEAARLLVDAGADVNSKNALGITPVAISAIVGNYKVLRIVANAPGVDLNSQDFEGNTALHAAVLSHKSEAIDILLEAGADPAVYNSACFTPILEAAKNGFYAGIEQFMLHFPQHVNMFKSDDGHTALHIAAANDHLDIVHLLASMRTCELNAQNFLNMLTPLHLAAQRGYCRIVECLVGYGADVSVLSSEGDTVLHFIVANKNMQPPSSCTPQIQKVGEKLQALRGGKAVSPYVTVVCFLAQEGADVRLQTQRGASALQLCFTIPEDAALVDEFTRERRLKVFHGTLPRIQPPTSSVTHQSFQQSNKEQQIGMPATQDSKTESSAPVPPVAAMKLPIQESSQSKESQPFAASTADTERDGASATTQETTDTAMDLCILCDKIADMKFEPCGHIAMCSLCAERVKRCPICRDPVQSKSRVAK